MNRYLMILPILLACPAAMAEAANTGIPFRVSALEERVDALEELAIAGEPGVVVQDSIGQAVGNVVLSAPWGARIFMEFPDKSAVFTVKPDGFSINSDVPPEVPKHVLLFVTADCNDADEFAPVYAPTEHISTSPWPEYHVIVAPEVDNAGARIPYAKIADEDLYPVETALWSDGNCGNWPPGRPDGEDPGLTPVTPVMPLMVCDDSNDLHSCYPPPYQLARP